MGRVGMCTKSNFPAFHITAGDYSYKYTSMWHYNTTLDTIKFSPSLYVRCVCFFDFILQPVPIIQGEEQVPGPIRTEGMFLSDHQDVYSLFG